MTGQTISLPYGRQQVVVSFPPGYKMTTLAARSGGAHPDPAAAVLAALRQPLGRPPLREWVHPGEKVAIITSDATRPALQYLYLPYILAELEEAGVADEDVLLVIGVGTHRPPTAAEIRRLLGETADRIAVTWSNCDDDAGLVHLGTTSRGTPVRIFRPVAEADRVLLTGSIHHHVLAGFSAGPKSLLPGVAGRDSIEANHALVLNPAGGLNPHCAAGVLDDNPLHEDFVEALRLFPRPLFLVNIVPAPEGGLLHVAAGDVVSAHRQGCRLADATYAVTAAEPRPFVFASCGGYPSDAVFYQSSKGLMNLSLALTGGGTAVLVAACDEGLGAEMFVEWLRLGSPEAIHEQLHAAFTVPGCIAYIVTSLVRRAHIILVSELELALTREFGLIPAASPQAAVDMVVQRLGPQASGYLLPKASITVPKPALP
ncbi:MAG: nickel-dependent lactate racemase [Anaerolineae bacterium]